MIKKTQLIKLVIWFILIIFFVFGCSFTIKKPKDPNLDYVKIPINPKLPEKELTKIEKIVNTNVLINQHRKKNKTLNTNSTFGVLDFKSSSKVTGSLVADLFSICLLRKKFKIVERQNINKIVEEHNMIVSGSQKLSDEDIVKKIGQISSADYLIVGAVTQFHFENMELPILFTVNDRNMDTYINQLNQYKENTEKILKIQQKQYDKYFQYVKDNLFYQMYFNDMEKWRKYNIEVGWGILRAIKMLFGYRYIWEYGNAAKLVWWRGYDYLENSSVCPQIGITKEEQQFRILSLEEDLKACKFEIINKLNRYDKKMTEDEFANANYSYRRYSRDNNPDNYIIKVKSLCDEIKSKIQQYSRINNELKRYKKEPIPQSIIQIEKPDPQIRFVSVANIGITFKIIEITTGDIVWIGQASKRDLNVQKGLSLMLSDIIDQLIISNSK
ncbi:Curli production assembly/transport component CsgG [Candidatus Magnetomorum sp. HK-1]|nr:Curli production assembly/transport component CsgG [Candidatus Magnetomorum sp. HK-1]